MRKHDRKWWKNMLVFLFSFQWDPWPRSLPLSLAFLESMLARLSVGLACTRSELGCLNMWTIPPTDHLQMLHTAEIQHIPRNWSSSWLILEVGISKYSNSTNISDPKKPEGVTPSRAPCLRLSSEAMQEGWSLHDSKYLMPCKKCPFLPVVSCCFLCPASGSILTSSSVFRRCKLNKFGVQIHLRKLPGQKSKRLGLESISGLNRSACSVWMASIHHLTPSDHLETTLPSFRPSCWPRQFDSLV